MMKTNAWIRSRNTRFDAFAGSDLQQVIDQVKKDRLPWLILNIAVVWGGIFLLAEVLAGFLGVALISDPPGIVIFLLAVALSSAISIVTYRRIILFFVRRQPAVASQT